MLLAWKPKCRCSIRQWRGSQGAWRGPPQWALRASAPVGHQGCLYHAFLRVQLRTSAVAENELEQALWDAIGDRIDMEVAAQMQSVGRDAANLRGADLLQLRFLGILVGLLWADSGRNLDLLDAVQEMVEEKSNEDERYKAVHALSKIVADTARQKRDRGLPPSDEQQPTQ